MSKKEDTQEHYSHIVQITCDLIATFKGKRGKVIVKNATAAIDRSPDLAQFVFELVYNAEAIGRQSALDEVEF